METINPTLEEFDEIIAFYPTLNRRDFDPIIEWKGGEQIEDNVNYMSWPIYDPVVQKFFDVASKKCWLDYNIDQSLMEKMINSDVFIQCADLPQIKQMLSYCVNGEKFISHGHMGTMIKEGHISRILKRLEKLKSEEDSVKVS